MKFGLIASLLLISGAVCAQDFQQKETSASNIRMTISNLGTIGNAFDGTYDVLGFSSAEFPANSGTEHLFEGGLWVGATIQNGPISVSTGAQGDASGYAPGKGGFEFTSEDGQFIERSTLSDNPHFAPQAVSHQDYVADFTDRRVFVPGTNIPINGHVAPLGIDVHFESYNWNYSFSNFFVILNFKIKNTGTNTLQDVYTGFWVDGVIRNVNITPARSGGSAFYNKGGNGYMDSLHMGYEFDAVGDVPFTDSYIGTKFLGTYGPTGFRNPKLDTTFKIFYNAWDFNSTAPRYSTPTSDIDKYARMRTGFNYRPDWETGATSIRADIKTPSNRSNLISAGPYATLAPGEEIEVAFAMVLARKFDDGQPTSADTDQQKAYLAQNAYWAQTAYDGEDENGNGLLDPGEDRNGNGELTRFVLPSPPASPITRVEASDNTIDIYWSDNAEMSIDPISKQQDFEGYRIYLTTLGFDVKGTQDVTRDLKLAKEYDVRGNSLFFDTGLDPIRLAQPKTFEGDANTYFYKYSISNIQNGWQHAISVTSFDRGDEVNNLPSLESSILANLKRVFPGKPANDDFANGEPFVYPNPYYAASAFEGVSTAEEDRKLIFANLPQRCQVRIYTTAGDLVDQFDHDQAYSGNDVKWFDTYSDTEKTVFSGGEHAWNLISAGNQLIARGLYLFSVEDLDSGKVQTGKFVVIK